MRTTVLLAGLVLFPLGCASSASNVPNRAGATATTATASGDLVVVALDAGAVRFSSVWDLLRNRFPRYNYVEDRFGRALYIQGHRGRSSISLGASDKPIVIIDGARLIAVDVLQQLPVDGVESIEILGGLTGTTRQGTNAGAGVISIHTIAGSVP